MLWRFSHRRRGCTSTARSQRNSRCRCYGFRGCAAVYIAVFPLALRRREAQCRRRGACHTASADLKELPSADLHGLLLVSTLSLLFHISLSETLREWLLFFFADGPAKVQNWINFPPSGGVVTEYHNVGVCVLIWLKESEQYTV